MTTPLNARNRRERLAGHRDRRAASGRRNSVLERQGLLVVLTGPEARGKDILISAARRRYATDPHFDFPGRIATRATELDDELIAITGRVFRDIESGNGFAVAWQHAGARHGLTAGALQALEAGRIVVVAAPREAIAQFQALWPRVEVLMLASEVDGARPWPGRRGVTIADTAIASSRRIHHDGDIATAVRRFHEVLDKLVSRECGLSETSRSRRPCV